MQQSTEAGARAVPSRLPTLTGLRFVAALSVFFFHITFEFLFTSQTTQMNFFRLFGYAGFTGVSFFFILSGFVLTWSARSTDTARSFWRRRLFRIFPNHVLATIACLGVLAYILKTPINGRAALLNVLLVQGWFPEWGIRSAANQVAWTLSCELLFYLAFPGLLLLVSRIRPERLWHWTGGVVAAIVLVPAASYLLPTNASLPGYPLTYNQHWFIYQLPPTRMLDFVLGILLARLILSGRRLPISVGGAVAVVVLATVLTPIVPIPWQIVAMGTIPGALVVAAAAGVDVDRGHGWLGSRTMVRLGDLSFAFYVFHWLIIIGGHGLLGGPGRTFGTIAGLGLVALLFLVTLTVAYLVFTFFETPIMRTFGTSRRRRAAARTLTPVATPAGPADPTDRPRSVEAGAA